MNTITAPLRAAPDGGYMVAMEVEILADYGCLVVTRGVRCSPSHHNRTMIVYVGGFDIRYHGDGSYMAGGDKTTLKEAKRVAQEYAPQFEALGIDTPKNDPAYRAHEIRALYRQLWAELHPHSSPP